HDEVHHQKTAATKDHHEDKPYEVQLVWRNIFALGILHLITLYTLTMVPSMHYATIFWAYAVIILGSMGVQSGAHRLWAHRSYQANFPLRFLLSMLHVLSLQNDLYEWVRDHRVHHKWSDTDADPHNSSRGFFFSHMGWLLVRKHPEVIRKGRTVDLSDLLADPIVMFQRRFYIPLVLLIWAYLPAATAVHGWGESWSNALCGVVVFRYVISLHITWLVNSWAHSIGNRPYDRSIAPVEASIRHWLMGEGFHNYHHTFPWDYSASELGPADVFNPGTAFIEFFQWLGWAWDLKKASPRLIAARLGSTGNPEEYLDVRRKLNSRAEWLGGLFTITQPLMAILAIKVVFSNKSVLQFFGSTVATK
ncbi:suppressor of clathrin deficiency, partial [Tyrophagus putrescentiae]